MHVKRKRHARVGMTLIELLVAMALMGVVLAAAGTMLLQSYASEAAYREQNQAQQNARAAVDILSDDLRGAGKSPSVTASVPTGTKTLNTTPFTFYIYDDSTPPVVRPVDYTFASGNLSRRVGGTASSYTVVARSIASSPTITVPAKPDGTPVGTADVDVTSTVGTPSTSTVRIRAKVTMRNYLF